MKRHIVACAIAAFCASHAQAQVANDFDATDAAAKAAAARAPTPGADAVQKAVSQTDPLAGSKPAPSIADDPYNPAAYDNTSYRYSSAEDVYPEGDYVQEQGLPPDAQGLIDLGSPQERLRGKIEAARYNAIKTAGLSYGAQGGLAYQTAINMTDLKAREKNIDALYNFQAMLLPSNVLPPVLAEVRDLYNQRGDDFIQIKNLNYQILQQARFVHSPPSWRNYLYRRYETPRNEFGAQPKNGEERALWEQSVREGFEMGRTQANQILRSGWQLLQRDYVGMMLYHRLLTEGVVTAPIVVTQQRDVAAKGNELAVGVTQLRIQAQPAFNNQRDQWRQDVGRASPPGYMRNQGAGLGQALPAKPARAAELGRYSAELPQVDRPKASSRQGKASNVYQN